MEEDNIVDAMVIEVDQAPNDNVLFHKPVQPTLHSGRPDNQPCTIMEEDNTVDAMVIEVDQAPNDNELIHKHVQPTVHRARPDNQPCTSMEEDNTVFMRMLKLVVRLLVAILKFLRAIVFYCLLTVPIIVVVSIFLLISTSLHVFRSMMGYNRYKIVASPRPDSSPFSTPMLAIIVLSVWLAIVRSVDSWEQRVLAGLNIEQWILISIIVLGYYCIRVLIHTFFTLFRWQCRRFTETVNCLLLLPTVSLIINVVPSFKHYKILGMVAWNWIRAIVVVVLAQYVVFIVVRIVKKVSKVLCRSSGKCKGQKCVYYYVKGLRKSIIFVIFSVIHLLTWKLYFHSRLTKNSAVAHQVSNFTWTLVTKLLCAIFWLIKNYILLSWKAHTVYERKDNEIVLRKLRGWYSLYCLDLIKLRGATNKPKNVGNEDKTAPSNLPQGWLSSFWKHFDMYKYLRPLLFVNTYKENKEAKCQTKRKKWEKARITIRKLVVKGESVMEANISIHEKQIISQAFLLEDKSLPGNQQISDFCKTVYNLHNSDSQRIFIKEKLVHPDYDFPDTFNDEIKEIYPIRGKYNVSEILTKYHKEDAAKFLREQLQEANKNAQEPIQAQDLQAWLEKAQQNCLQMQHFKTSAQAVVKFLNRLIIGFIVLLLIIIWLLLTHILSTKVIVVISTPLLAATFIFGDTLKTMFQGIVYAYFMHPFTVGDLCIIDKTQMEVQQIGVWRTTFSKLGTDQDVLYPNFDLLRKAIINHGGNIILHDSVEFSLKYDTNEARVKELQRLINSIRKKKSSTGNESVHQTSSLSSEEEEIDGVQNNTSEGNPDAHEDNIGIVSHYDDEANQNHDEENNARSEHQPLTAVSNNYYYDDEENNAANQNHVVVKQIQNNIKMALYIDYDKRILDMTNAQAFNEKMKQKSDYLRQIADLISAK